MSESRLIIDSDADGAWNMSVDQAILETANRTGLVTLRFYSWSEPTLSLGYFQSHHDRFLHKPSLDCPLVRRRTGGGAIVHDHELTYSLCIPSTNRWSSRNSDLYRTVHECLIEVLRGFGIVAHLYEESRKVGANSDEKPFMCYHRRTNGDIVVQRHKVVGSAQRRLKNSLLQHGSILLEKSEFSPELPGLADLFDKPIEVSKLITKLATLVGNRFSTKFTLGELSKFEKEAAKRVNCDQFACDRWNLRR
jgi:lipoate-protein ligase A